MWVHLGSLVLVWFFGQGVELCSCIGAVVGSGCFRLFCGFDAVGLLFGCPSFSVARCFFLWCIEWCYIDPAGSTVVVYL